MKNKGLKRFYLFFILLILLTSCIYSGFGINKSLGYHSSVSETQRSARGLYIIDLNTTTIYPHQNVTIYGAGNGDSTGRSVASGDVNGDGKDDIIIGAGGADGVGDLKNGCGEVYVIFNNGSIIFDIDLASQADMVIYGKDSGDNLGSDIAIGDVNNDAIVDMILGASGADGPSDGRQGCGEVYVIYGNGALPASKDLSSSPPDVIIYGADVWDFLYSIDIGDINGDNTDDIIMGAYMADGPGDGRNGCGEAYVIFGNTTMPSEIDLGSQADVTIYGADSSDYAGMSVYAGDVDNNGYDDIIIGAPMGDGPSNMRDSYGEAYLIYGNNTLPSPSTIDLATQADMTIYSNSGAISYFGGSVASGDVNGDNYDDILICARQEGSSTGAIYIIYCNASLPLIRDLQTEQADVIIIGDGGQAGSAIIAEDLNGDLIDDIIISAWQANGPGGMRNICGEVYIINGSSSLPSTIDISLSQEDILIYGDESGDWAGSSLSVGKIDNDDAYDIVIGAGNADGVNNGRTTSGEVYLIFSSGKMFDILKTEFIGLINGDGSNKKTCYAKHKPYDFKVKITNPKGFADLNTVTLGLDFLGENLRYSWSESTQEFSELADPNNYAELNTTSSAKNDGEQIWVIDFNITFNWSYPDNDFHGVQFFSTGDTGLYDWFNYSANVYQVENRVNFNGTVKVTGNYQGALNEDDWVRGGEQLTWGGLKVVYNGTNTLYPPLDSGVTVTVWDSDTEFWTDTPNPGENISIITPANNVTKLNKTYLINITGIPSSCDKSNITFDLSIDGDNVTFSNPIPSPEKWNTILNPKCSVIILDPTTKVNVSSIQYRISTDNGTTWENDWTGANIQQNDGKEINCIVQPVFKDGRDNLIQWRAKDILGNGYNDSEKYRILIDLSNVTFINPIPSSDEWQTNLSVMCNITIIDDLSGVNASSIEFRISTNGIYNYGIWQSARQTIDSNIIYCSVNPIFEEGDDNCIQWRAKDIVGNGPYVSEDYQIKIKINYPPETSLISPIRGSILKALTLELFWKGTDPDADTPIYYNVYLSNDENKITNLDPSSIIVSDFQDTKYKLESPLEDGFTYYWTVIPNDGIIDGICVSGIWHFKIDTTVEIPIVTLISPINNSHISTQTPTLSWKTNYSNSNIVTYSVFLDTLSDPENYTEDYKSTFYVPSIPLTPGETYYWKVIPIANTDEGKIQGECDSRVWRFTIEVGVVNIYGVNLEIEIDNLTIKQGEYISTNITVTNTGNSVDMINLNLEKGILDANVALEHLGTPLRLNSSESVLLKLEIKIFENTDPQNYTLTITAISNGALSENQDVSVSKSIQLRVIEKGSLEDMGRTRKEEGSLALWIAILVIIIIFILIFGLFIYRKKQAKKIQVLSAELEYKPPGIVDVPELPGITTPASGVAAKPELPVPTITQAQPQVTTGVTSAPSLAAPGVKPLLQLPQATLTKAQQLNLLRERFLRGEVTEETYNKLRAEIEGSTDEEDNIVEDLTTDDVQLSMPEAEVPAGAPIPAVPPQPGTVPSQEQQASDVAPPAQELPKTPQIAAPLPIIVPKPIKVESKPELISEDPRKLKENIQEDKESSE